MFSYYFIILLFIFVVSISVSQTFTSCSLQPGTRRKTIDIQGTSRDYQLYVPQGISFPTSVVFAWHGLTSSPTTAEEYMQLKPQV